MILILTSINSTIDKQVYFRVIHKSLKGALLVYTRFDAMLGCLWHCRPRNQ